MAWAQELLHRVNAYREQGNWQIEAGRNFWSQWLGFVKGKQSFLKLKYPTVKQKLFHGFKFLLCFETEDFALGQADLT